MIKGKKWLLLAGLGILTVSLIFVFREKDTGDFVRQQGSSLLSFYTKNLKPLFTSSPISKEDVFNFALYEELPLDKENNQYLQLGSLEGQEYFEFRKSEESTRTRNLENFTRELNLNERQKKQMDSILESYSDQLSDKILVNENNTIAINTNLWNLRNAVLADVMSFAARSNKDFASQHREFNSGSSPSVNELIKDIRTVRDTNYIFVTPDTIFTRAYSIDREKMREDLAHMRDNLEKQREAMRVRIDFNKEIAKLQKQKAKTDYKFHIDSNSFRIQVPDVEIPEVPEIEVALEEVSKAMESFRFEISPPTPDNKHRTSIKMKIPDVPNTPNKGFELNIDIPQVDSLVLETLNGANLMDAEYWERFGEKMDSIGELYENGENFDRQKFLEEMRKVKKDLEKSKVKKKTSVEVK